MDIAVGETIILDNRRSPWDVTDPYSQESIDSGLRWDKLPHTLMPYSRALLTSAEPVDLSVSALGLYPVQYAGIICLRSTWARLGLLIPPTIIDPGFHGLLTLEVFNSSANQIRIRTGDSLWHMILVPAPYEVTYTGRYQGQDKLTPAKSLDVPREEYMHGGLSDIELEAEEC